MMKKRLEKIRDGWARRRPTLKATILGLTGLASLFAVLSASDCSFMVAARYSYDSAQVGLFSQAVYDLTSAGADEGASAPSTTKLGCVAYTNREEFDGMFRAGRAFAVLTPLATLASLVLMAWSLAWRPTFALQLWRASKGLAIAGTISQMLVFLAVGSSFMCSQQDCRLTGVGVLAAINIVLLVGTSVAMYLEPAPTRPWLAWWIEETPTYLQNVDPRVSDYIRSMQEQRRSADVEIREKETDRHQVFMGEPTSLAQLPEASLDYDDDNEASRERDGGRLALEDSADSDSTTVVGLQHLTTFRLILVSLFLFAWAVSVAGVSRCSFFMVGPAGEDISHFTGMGLFSRAIYYDGRVTGCLDYASQLKADFDPVFVASRVFGTVTALLMTLVLMLVLLQLFVNCRRVELWFLVRLFLPCATLCQLFVFFVYKTQICQSSSQVECVPGELGIWVIINVILMAVLCFLAFVMPPPPHPLFAVVHHTRSCDMPNSKDQESRKEKARPSGLPDAPNLSGTKKSPAKRASSSDGTSVLSEEAAQHGFSLERIVRVNPLKARRSRLRASQRPIPVPPDNAFYHSNDSVVSQTSSLEAGPASLITVSLEYSGTQKRIIKTVTHPDGSKTITTTIEELGSSTEGSSAIGDSSSEPPFFTDEDGASDCDAGGIAGRRQPAVADADYEDEEEKLIACMIRDPPGTTATGRFVATKRAAQSHDSCSEHAVKEIIVVEGQSESEKGAETDCDASLGVESTSAEK